MDIYDFPPFFTRQPNEDSWKVQKEKWAEVIKRYCVENHNFKVTFNCPVFTNSKIDRRLKDERVINEIFMYMCEGKLAERVADNEIYVYREKPEELASMLVQWADKTGNQGSVMTFYELSEGEYPGLENFKDMETVLLKKVAKLLAKQGKVAEMKEGKDVVGVKFA